MYERNSRHRETILDISLFAGCSKDTCSSAQYLSGSVVSQHHFAKENESPPSTFTFAMVKDIATPVRKGGWGEMSPLTDLPPPPPRGKVLKTMCPLQPRVYGLFP